MTVEIATLSQWVEEDRMRSDDGLERPRAVRRSALRERVRGRSLDIPTDEPSSVRFAATFCQREKDDAYASSSISTPGADFSAPLSAPSSR